MLSNVDRLEVANKRLSRRALLLGGGQVAVVLVIAGRLTFLQTVASEDFRSLAESNRINIRLLTPERGIIADRNGEILAANRKDYWVTIVREQAGDVEKILDRLSRIIPMSEDEKGRKLDEVYRNRLYVPVLVADDVTWEQVAAISVNAPALPGVTCDVGNSRIYPFGNDFSHLVGYVGKVSPEDLEKQISFEPLLYQPNFQIGKTGVEKSLDGILRGRAGNRKFEVNATGRIMRELDRIEAQPGNQVQLTIDQKLQNFVVARLSNHAASVVVLDALNGDVLAMTSTPTFDPNKFATGISSSEFQDYLNNGYSPLFNRPIQGRYPPGSVYKMITALAALEEGVITPEDEFECTGSYETSQRRFHCWKSGGHGIVNLKKSLSESCDVYYYNMAELVGIEKISEMARRFGLGERPYLPLPEMTSGNVPTIAWKAQRLDQPWHIGDTLNSAIGQGYVLASALQIAIMTVRLATKIGMSPRLVLSIDGEETPSVQPFELNISEESLDLVRDGMTAVVNERAGTAFDSRCIDTDFIIAGKTGTSQIRTITAEERQRGLIQTEDLPWNRRDHALFCGYAPSSNPKIAVAVIIEHGGGGAAVAAPIARDILMRAHYGTLPPIQAYPAEIRRLIQQQQEELELRRQGTSEPGSARA